MCIVSVYKISTEIYN